MQAEVEVEVEVEVEEEEVVEVEVKTYCFLMSSCWKLLKHTMFCRTPWDLWFQPLFGDLKW